MHEVSSFATVPSEIHIPGLRHRAADFFASPGDGKKVLDKGPDMPAGLFEQLFVLLRRQNDSCRLTVPRHHLRRIGMRRLDNRAEIVSGILERPYRRHLIRIPLSKFYLVRYGSATWHFGKS